MVTVHTPYSDGPEGIAATLALLTRLKDYYGSLPVIRQTALAIARSDTDSDHGAQLAQLARFVKNSLVYQADPVNAEFIQTPDVLLLEINATGRAQGDCDDHVLLFCALAESLGISCDVAGVAANRSPNINHVIAVAHVAGQTVDVDLCAKSDFQPVYSEKLIVA